MFGYNKDLTKEEIQHYSEKLSSWKKFNSFLNDMTESALKKAFIVELQTRNRFTVLKRIKGRINKIVMRREDLELSKLFE
jgi:hypothetical protein